MFDCAPASPGPRRRIVTLMLALLPWKVKDKQHLDVTGDTSVPGSFQSLQFDGIDSDKEDFALPLCLLSRQFVSGWNEAAGCIDVTPCPRPGLRLICIKELGSLHPLKLRLQEQEA